MIDAVVAINVIFVDVAFYAFAGVVVVGGEDYAVTTLLPHFSMDSFH